MLRTPPLSLYVHVPWCVRKCPYCDFNSHERRGEVQWREYVDALIRDLEQDLPLVWGRVVHSVFFGGGTPSLMPPEFMDDFLQRASALLSLAPGCEITLETNPGTAEHGRFEGYRAAGINRLSFGIQSFDDRALQTLGRIHNSGEAERAVRMAQDAGYDNINLDLMYALPEQDLAGALHDIERALALNPTHISHYQLTLEPNTVFYARPPERLPDDDSAWDMQMECQSALAAAGFKQYEVSAYARDNRRCQHNLNYWQYGDYLGIGAGAHGKITEGAAQQIRRRDKLKHPRVYLDTVGTPANFGTDEMVTADRLPFEFMMNALRLNDGFPLSMFELRTGLDRAVIAQPLAMALERELITVEGDLVCPTELGRRFTNDLMELFL